LTQKLRRLEPAVVRLIGFVAVLAATGALLYFGRHLLLPLLLGLTVAYLLDPAVNWFERRGRSRVTGTVIIAAIATVAMLLFLLILVPILGNQVQQLRDRFPEYKAQVEARFEPLRERLEAQYPAELEELRMRAEQTVREKWPQLVESAIGTLGGVFSSVLGFFLFLLNLIFVPVFAFYLLVDFPKLKTAIQGLIPIPYREMTLARLGEVDSAVSSFLRGQLTIALILAAINGIGLTLVGVPLGLLVGIVAGLANMIPYMALVVGLAPAVLLVWIEHQSLARVIAVIVVFSGAQMLEGTVLSPRILSKSVNLHPVWVLLAIIVGGNLFGIVGMIVSVPATAAIQVFVRHWIVAYKGSDVYRGDAESASIET